MRTLHRPSGLGSTAAACILLLSCLSDRACCADLSEPSPLGIFALHRGGKIYEKLLEDVGKLLPNVIHRVLPASSDTERVIVVGDVHGCLDELRELLEKVQHNNATDILLFTGDLGNRGPHSVGVIQEIQRVGGLSARGNNDDAALAAWEANRQGLPVPFLFQWVKELPDADAKWLYELPWSVSIPHLGLIIVHGGLIPGVPLDRQDLNDLYEIREVVQDGTGHWRMASKGLEEGLDWASVWNGPEHIVFGHDAKRGLQDMPLATGLDTGVCYGFHLTAVVIQANEKAMQDLHAGAGLSQEFVSVPAHRRYA